MSTAPATARRRWHHLMSAAAGTPMLRRLIVVGLIPPVSTDVPRTVGDCPVIDRSVYAEEPLDLSLNWVMTW